MLDNKYEMSSQEIPQRRQSTTSKLVTEDWYTKLLGECKARAAKQKDLQVQEAELLIKRGSPASKRRGRIILKAAANLEKEAVEALEVQLHTRMTVEAEIFCYGNTSSRTLPTAEFENVLERKLS